MCHVIIILVYFIQLQVSLAVKNKFCLKTESFYYKKECKDVCTRNEEKSLDSHNWSAKQRDTINRMATGSNLNGLYRPRSALARALYEKQRNDRLLEEFDQSELYRVETSKLTPELREKFIQLHPDEETKEFLTSSTDKSSWVWTQIWYLLAKAVLRHFWSNTDINGWLGRGSMFVLSNAQARSLLQLPAGSGAVESLVDVGAGDGEVSRRFADIFERKYATEISGSMRKALYNKGYTVLDTEGWCREGREYSCVCMLNLLDRCGRPRSMLRQARAALRPPSVLLLALVLPYKPYVEVTPDHKPEERLPIHGDTFEEQVESLVTFMKEEGFALKSWTRTPYFCEGDFGQAYYWLDDSVFVFTPTSIKQEL